MVRTTTAVFFILLLFVLALEPALANKFETIGGGVSGLSREKILLLKNIVYYTGGFFVFLGVMALITRNRFEGFAGMTGKDANTALKGGFSMLIIGLILVGLSFI